MSVPLNYRLVPTLALTISSNPSTSLVITTYTRICQPMKCSYLQSLEVRAVSDLDEGEVLAARAHGPGPSRDLNDLVQELLMRVEQLRNADAVSIGGRRDHLLVDHCRSYAGLIFPEVLVLFLDVFLLSRGSLFNGLLLLGLLLFDWLLFLIWVSRFHVSPC